MAESLCSVGLDVGTTSTQLIVSRLAVENQAGSFSVPRMQIVDREILYKSPVHFTPLLGTSQVDGPALKRIVEAEYEKAGIRQQNVDTGAIIITGETSRKENAARVLQELEGFAGEFVVATAGPNLESVLAARGAGAVEYSRDTGKTVLHMDIGGGTSNLALIEAGEIVETGCLNVGGRLIKFDKAAMVTYVSPVLRGIWNVRVGEKVTPERLREGAEILVSALEMAAGYRPATALLEALVTEEAGLPRPREKMVISFSGGVADCIEKDLPWDAFGDLGPILGQGIRESGLCRGEYTLGSETIRATVIGAGCHSTQLSGSTVFFRNVRFPLKNLPVLCLPDSCREPKQVEEYLQGQVWEETPVIALPEMPFKYSGLRELAKVLQRCCPGPVYVCLEQDMAKALGQILALELPAQREILCIDRVSLGQQTYLDVGAPLGPALPVVVKTLVLGKGDR